METLKIARQKKGLTRLELGELVGVEANYIYLLETGRRSNPTKRLIEKLALALDLSPVEIFVGFEKSA
ncbi:MAG: helix-turn-helix domain-containing protein [Patescibacteria group bacterium]|nr:helix-turn-helix domain-containing protein [Patescibacteria group bacterium]